jgi:hypothetical protein
MTNKHSYNNFSIGNILSEDGCYATTSYKNKWCKYSYIIVLTYGGTLNQRNLMYHNWPQWIQIHPDIPSVTFINQILI